MELITILLIIAALVIAFAAGWWFGRRRASSLETEVAVLGSRLQSEDSLEIERNTALERAMEQTPRTCGSAENSALRFGFLEPPMPVPVGSPPCAMKPSITR